MMASDLGRVPMGRMLSKGQKTEGIEIGDGLRLEEVWLEASGLLTIE